MKRDEKRFQFKNQDGYYSDLEVLQSGAGYYIGRLHWNSDMGGFVEPGSRESGYYATQEEAARELESMTFDLRNADENEAMYEAGTVPRPVTSPGKKEPRMAYAVVLDNERGGFTLGVAREGEHGYHPFTRAACHPTFEAAQEVADAQNKLLGLGAREAALIVGSTMGGFRRNRRKNGATR